MLNTIAPCRWSDRCYRASRELFSNYL